MNPLMGFYNYISLSPQMIKEMRQMSFSHNQSNWDYARSRRNPKRKKRCRY